MKKTKTCCFFNTRLAGVLVLLPLLFLPAAANPLIWENGTPNQFGGNNMTEFLQAEDFNLSSTFIVTDVRFWNLQGVAGDYLGSVYWAIYSDLSGTPDAILASGVQNTVTRAATGLAVDTFSEFQNDFAITPTLLTSGTYWLALHDGALTSTDFLDFYWETTDIGGGNAITNRGMESDLFVATPFTTNAAEHAYQLYGISQGEVPEPATWILLLGGAGLTALLRRRLAR